MSGAEIEPTVLRRFLKQSMAIGAVSFAAPFLGAMLYARYVSGWDWDAAKICGIALSTTSVAVVYAVMIETGLNETEAKALFFLVGPAAEVSPTAMAASRVILSSIETL